jgi:small subunit ribosomal protein S4
MSRYRGPRLRLQRRLGVRLPGLTTKLKKRKKSPGQHGQEPSKIRKSAYRIRLEEKQKLRFNYSVTEKQLFRYVKEARKIKGSTGFIILQFLEMRLDTIVYRLNLAPTIIAARQLVSHGHIKVNNHLVTIPSFQCQGGDIVEVLENEKSVNLVKNLTNNFTLINNVILSKTKKKKYFPAHLSIKSKQLKGFVTKVVSRKDINLPINELLVVEFYSRR